MACNADKYELDAARIAGDSCIVASGKQLSSGCAVVLKFFVDKDDFSHLKRFHHQARDPQYIPGTPPQHLPSIEDQKVPNCRCLIASTSCFKLHVTPQADVSRRSTTTQPGDIE